MVTLSPSGTALEAQVWRLFRNRNNRQSYGSLRDQVEHYRADSNWRGNMAIRCADRALRVTTAAAMQAERGGDDDERSEPPRQTECAARRIFE